MILEEKTSFCRFCSAGCGVRIQVEDGRRIVKIRGDNDQPMSKGYACFKGLQAAEWHHGEQRLLRPLKREPDGTFREIELDQALDEIAERLGTIIERHGSDGLALYQGTAAAMNSSVHPMLRDFLDAFGSSQLFTTYTIDQSAGAVCFERLGGWDAGRQDIKGADVIMLFGANPLISHLTIGLFGTEPMKRIRAERKRGMKLIVVDPRNTETADYADMFLQPLPGQDAVIAGAMIRTILENGWEDAQFCERWVGAGGMARLRGAVGPLSPALVEQRARLQPGQIEQAAQIFARDAGCGAAYTSTGLAMSPFSNLAQHLVETLNVICGRYRRAGGTMPFNAFGPSRPIRAEAISPPRQFEQQGPGRIRGARTIFGEKPTGTLADEILTPGEGQVRALFCVAGNPAAAVPDQARVAQAFRSLDLLVVTDPVMSNTARLADYILAPVMPYERYDIPVSTPGMALFPDSWAQLAQPIVAPPEGSALVEDAVLLWSVASRLGRQIRYCGQYPLDMQTPPKVEGLLRLRLQGCPVSFEELSQYPSGHIFPDDVVQEAGPDAQGRFDVMPADVAGELERCVAAAYLPQQAADGTAFTHVFSSRRMRDVFNSTGTTLLAVAKRTPYNPAYVNPADLVALGIADGDRISITSALSSVEAVAKGDPTVRTGVLSMAHSWGGLPDGEGMPGANTNRLIDCHRHFESINAMPWMSGFPVSIRKAAPDRDPGLSSVVVAPAR